MQHCDRAIVLAECVCYVCNYIAGLCVCFTYNVVFSMRVYVLVLM